MDKENKHIDIELIVRYLSGEASGDEKAGLDKWMAESTENLSRFEEYRKVWKNMDKVSPVAGMDLDAEWAKMDQTISKSGQGSKSDQDHITDRRRLGFSPLRIAASIAILLTLSLSIWFVSGRAGYKSYITENQTMEINLPDGSKVTLNQFSEISYRIKFRKDTREIQLEGEAFFEVKPDKTKPFTVVTEKIEVTVLGTSFNVNAYSHKEKVEVVVATGQVAMSLPGDSPQSLILKPGNLGIYTKEQNALKLDINRDRNFLSWKTRKFFFEDQMLQEVVKQLGEVYHADIRLMDDSLKKLHITTSFENQSIDAILKVISATLDLELSRKGDIYQLHAAK